MPLAWPSPREGRRRSQCELDGRAARTPLTHTLACSTDKGSLPLRLPAGLLRTGFLLATAAAVSCGVKLALLQTVLQEGQDTMPRLSPTATLYLMAPVVVVALLPLQAALEFERVGQYHLRVMCIQIEILT
jgi:hypothetical protein